MSGTMSYTQNNVGDLSHGIYTIDYTEQDSALSKKALGTQASIMDMEITSTMADMFSFPLIPGYPEFLVK